MSTINDGGPIAANIDPLADGSLVSVGGLSIRDWFAGMALQGLLTQRTNKGDYVLGCQHGAEGVEVGIHYKGESCCQYESDSDLLASDAYEIADEMLSARERKEEP